MHTVCLNNQLVALPGVGTLTSTIWTVWVWVSISVTGCCVDPPWPTLLPSSSSGCSCGPQHKEPQSESRWMCHQWGQQGCQTHRKPVWSPPENSPWEGHKLRHVLLMTLDYNKLQRELRPPLDFRPTAALTFGKFLNSVWSVPVWLPAWLHLLCAASNKTPACFLHRAEWTDSSSAVLTLKTAKAWPKGSRKAAGGQPECNRNELQSTDPQETWEGVSPGPSSSQDEGNSVAGEDSS